MAVDFVDIFEVLVC